MILKRIYITYVTTQFYDSDHQVGFTDIPQLKVSWWKKCKQMPAAVAT